MRRTYSWSMHKHFRNTLYIKNYWERGDKDFILIKVGGAKIRNAMLHGYRACQVFPLRYDCFRHAQPIVKYDLKRVHTTEITALSILILMGWLEDDADWNPNVCRYSLFYFLSVVLQPNLRLEWLFVEVPRSNTQLDTHAHTTGLLRRSDQLVAQAATNTQRKTKYRKEIPVAYLDSNPRSHE